MRMHLCTSALSKSGLGRSILENSDCKGRVSEWLISTGKLPRLALVEVNFSNGSTGEATVENLLEKVVSDELLVGGMEAEPGRQVVVVAAAAAGDGVVMSKGRNIHGSEKARNWRGRKKSKGNPEEKGQNPDEKSIERSEMEIKDVWGREERGKIIKGWKNVGFFFWFLKMCMRQGGVVIWVCVRAWGSVQVFLCQWRKSNENPTYQLLIFFSVSPTHYTIKTFSFSLFLFSFLGFCLFLFVILKKFKFVTLHQIHLWTGF